MAVLFLIITKNIAAKLTQKTFSWFVILLNLLNSYTLIIVLFQESKPILSVIDPIEEDKQYGFEIFTR